MIIVSLDGGVVINGIKSSYFQRTFIAKDFVTLVELELLASVKFCQNWVTQI